MRYISFAVHQWLLDVRQMLDYRKLARLKLASQFSVFLSIIFITGITLGGLLLSKALEQKAYSEMSYRGQMVMQMTDAVSSYTTQEIAPLITQFTDTQTKFIPETIPSLAAQKVVDRLKHNWKYKDFIYKTATLNPTNLDNQADLFEAKLIEQFNRDRTLKTLSDFRYLSDKKLFYTAQPLIVTDSSCLKCHSTPESAPKSHVEKYGTRNGYGWKLNQVIGSQIIYIPASEVFLNVRRAIFLFLGIFMSIFALVIVSTKYLVTARVIQPLKPMAKIAQIISQETIDINQVCILEHQELTKIVKRKDELGQLGRVFQNMISEIFHRQEEEQRRANELSRQLQQLQTEVEQQNITQEVQEITESDYFQQLQKTARKIRSEGERERVSE